MPTLLAISALALAALLWAAFSAARHVRRARRQPLEERRDDQRVADDASVILNLCTSRPLASDVPGATVISADAVSVLPRVPASPASVPPEVYLPRLGYATPVLPLQARADRVGDEQRAQPKEESSAPPPPTKKPSTSTRFASSRPSQLAQNGAMDRSDWAYFNKDMGDLSDPYEAPRHPSRIASGESRR